MSQGVNDRNEDNKMQLWVISAYGGESKRLTNLKGDIHKPEWSPNGREILFHSNVFTGNRSECDDVKIIERIRYRFDGKGYSLGLRPHLFTVPNWGGKIRQLTDGAFDVEEASFSPNGERIAFVSNLDEDADLSFYKHIYVTSLKGGEQELLWDGEKAEIGLSGNGAITWSPDGKNIAFIGRTIENPNLVLYKNSEIWVLPIKEGKIRNLTTEFDRTVSRGPLQWSSDSKTIYFKNPEKGSIQLCKVNLEDKVERVITGKMTINEFNLSELGPIIAFSAMDHITLNELWIKDEQGIRCLTKMNENLMKKLRLVEPEEFWFKASDGEGVQGWIIKPNGYVEGKKYPMILGIHGGPHGAYGYRIMTDFQALADNGFAVAYANPRGSIGFGESYAAGITGNWGELDYQDIMETVDYVIKTYSFIDSKRLGVMGGSYGGYMTNWVIGHTDRFKAAVSLNSISNMYSDWGTGDTSWNLHDFTRGNDPWDDLRFFMEKSPITYIKNIRTPLLLIHSEQDYRCNIEESEQLFLGLKRLRKVVEFIRFPGSHGFGRIGKPKHRTERLRHIIRWFDSNLNETK